MNAIRNFFRGVPATHTYNSLNRIVVLLVLIWLTLVVILVTGR